MQARRARRAADAGAAERVKAAEELVRHYEAEHCLVHAGVARLREELGRGEVELAVTAPVRR